MRIINIILLILVFNCGLYSQIIKPEVYRCNSHKQNDLVVIQEGTLFLIMDRGWYYLYAGKFADNYICHIPILDINYGTIKSSLENKDRETKLIIENTAYMPPYYKKDSLLLGVRNPFVVFYDSINNIKFSKTIGDGVLQNQKRIFSLPIKFIQDKHINWIHKNSKYLEKNQIPDTLRYDYISFSFADEKNYTESVFVKNNYTIRAEIYFYPLTRFMKTKKVKYKLKNENLIIEYPDEFLEPVYPLNKSKKKYRKKEMKFERISKNELTEKEKALFYYMLNNLDNKENKY
ncbi:hypothetical protein D0T53_10280 [Dysgonomonas sp. 216]|uniref:hypothetical protein n=1 Tax=Dysgonomonas sp. 216 TaxID=2302934 RepID=UPI0013CF4747|nr:hypothetical protein [Dysgonomonas sp. 216]NDW19298.1 hypothetical protein [Dysgonomonas sp. 216]